MFIENTSTIKEANDILDEIQDHIQDITTYSKNFRHQTEKTYDKIELAFLKQLLNKIAILENDSLLLKEEFHEIQQNIPTNNKNILERKEA